jgi:hypothetical protein
MLADEGLAEGLEPTVGTGIGCAEGLCGGEGDVGALCPSVHVCDVAGEDDLCSWLHCSGRRTGTTEGTGRGEKSWGKKKWEVFVSDTAMH